MTSSSAYASIVAMLQTDPHGALTALDGLAGPDRDTREAWDLRARALWLLGRQHEAYGDPGTAITCWEQALQCNDASLDGELSVAIQELCHRTGAALAQAGRPAEALQIVDRGLALIQSERLAALRRQLEPPPPVSRTVPAPQRPAAAAPPPHASSSARSARGAGALESAQRVSRRVAFNDLPAESRQRFVDCAQRRATPAPLHIEPTGGVTGPVLGLLLAAGVLASFAASGFAQAGGSSYDSAGWLVGYALLTFAVLAAILAIVHARIVRWTLPYTAGTYLFPADIVIADRDGSLVVLPLRELQSLKCVHHSTNGGYTHSLCHFQFSHELHSCRFGSQAAAEAALQQLSQAERTQAAAAQMGDVETLAALDPLAALPGRAAAAAPAVRAMPAWLRWRFAIAAAAGLVLAVPLWAGRNVLSDYSLFSETEVLGTEAAYRQYVVQGWLFKARAQERLPRVAFAEARRKGTVTALRAVLRNYPGSPVDADVRAEIRAAYEKSRARFRAQAANADPVMVAFLERLVDYMVAKDLSTVSVRFRSPNPAALAKEDQRLSARAASSFRSMAPIAPHFEEKTARQRESAIVNRLDKAFAAIFPADVLALKMGQRLPAAGMVANDVPAILIDYAVVPSGVIYESSSNPLSKLFVGIKVAFKVSMRVPDTARSFDFAMDVAPPEHFTVNYDTLTTFSGPPDERVYAVMAERAFDQLSTKLQRAFFPAADKAAPAARK